VLESFQQQKYKSFELVIADDGSNDETRKLIDNYKKNASFPVIHAWHEDKGFRAAAARNNAVHQSSGEYLIFLDGDCMVFDEFLFGHNQLAEEKWFVRGSRVMLNEAYTKNILSTGKLPSNIFGWLYRKIKGDVKRITPLIKILSLDKKRVSKKWYGVKTCNLGIWRKDFYAINGFNEDFIGWGHEDADLAVRLIRNGIRRKEGRHVVPVVHLWHKENDRSTLSDNEKRLDSIIQSNEIRCASGIDKYTS
jgi:glycosyltransferase involved in cell wall biosynthesis